MIRRRITKGLGGAGGRGGGSRNRAKTNRIHDQSRDATVLFLARLGLFLVAADSGRHLMPRPIKGRRCRTLAEWHLLLMRPDYGADESGWGLTSWLAAPLVNQGAKK